MGNGVESIRKKELILSLDSVQTFSVGGDLQIDTSLSSVREMPAKMQGIMAYFSNMHITCTLMGSGRHVEHGFYKMVGEDYSEDRGLRVLEKIAAILAKARKENVFYVHALMVRNADTTTEGEVEECKDILLGALLAGCTVIPEKLHHARGGMELVNFTIDTSSMQE